MQEGWKIPFAFPIPFHYHFTMKQKLFSSLLVLLVAFLVKFTFIKLPALDDAREKYFSTSIKKAAVTYAAVRGVNAALVSSATQFTLPKEPNF